MFVLCLLPKSFLCDCNTNLFMLILFALDGPVILALQYR